MDRRSWNDVGQFQENQKSKLKTSTTTLMMWTWNDILEWCRSVWWESKNKMNDVHRRSWNDIVQLNENNAGIKDEEEHEDERWGVLIYLLIANFFKANYFSIVQRVNGNSWELWYRSWARIRLQVLKSYLFFRSDE